MCATRDAVIRRKFSREWNANSIDRKFHLSLGYCGVGLERGSKNGGGNGGENVMEELHNKVQKRGGSERKKGRLGAETALKTHYCPGVAISGLQVVLEGEGGKLEMDKARRK